LIVDDDVKIAIQERAPALHLQRILERRGKLPCSKKPFAKLPQASFRWRKPVSSARWALRSRLLRRDNCAIFFCAEWENSKVAVRSRCFVN
jgi:hypothetical protein